MLLLHGGLANSCGDRRRGPLRVLRVPEPYSITLQPIVHSCGATSSRPALTSSLFVVRSSTSCFPSLPRAPRFSYESRLETRRPDVPQRPRPLDLPGVYVNTLADTTIQSPYLQPLSTIPLHPLVPPATSLIERRPNIIPPPFP